MAAIIEVTAHSCAEQIRAWNMKLDGEGTTLARPLRQVLAEVNVEG